MTKEKTMLASTQPDLFHGKKTMDWVQEDLDTRYAQHAKGKGSGHPPKVARAKAMTALRKAGWTLEAIGQAHEISRERVRQVLLKHAPELKGYFYKHSPIPRDEAWLIQVWTEGTAAVAEREGVTPGAIVKRCQRMCEGRSPDEERRRLMDEVGPEALAMRQAGKTWLAVRRHYITRLPWLARRWARGEDGWAGGYTAAANELATYCKRHGLEDGLVRTTKGRKDPAKGPREVARLRKEGWSYPMIARHLGYASKESAQHAGVYAKKRGWL